MVLRLPIPLRLPLLVELRPGLDEKLVGQRRWRDATARSRPAAEDFPERVLGPSEIVVFDLRVIEQRGVDGARSSGADLERDLVALRAAHQAVDHCVASPCHVRSWSAFLSSTK